MRRALRAISEASSSRRERSSASRSEALVDAISSLSLSLRSATKLGHPDQKEPTISDRHTKLNLADVDDAAPGNGFGDRWEARVARSDLGAEQTGLTHFRLRPGRRSPFSHRHRTAEEIYVVLSGHGRMKLGETIIDVGPLDAIRVPPETARALEAGADGLEFIAFGPHNPGDGEPVDDPWIAEE